jgi:hypothetical protein
MAQFTAINGKKIPKELYNAGENFSTTISTNCTIGFMSFGGMLTGGDEEEKKPEMTIEAINTQEKELANTIKGTE